MSSPFTEPSAIASSSRHWFDIFGRANLHWTFKGVHFTLIDSGSALVAGQVYRWLDGWLAEGRDAVHIFATHIPPLDPIGVRGGDFTDRNEGAALVAKLARAGVDLTIYGHIHSYYAYSNAGIPAYISGGGGAIPERFDGIGRHYLTVEVDPAGGIRDVSLVRIGPASHCDDRGQLEDVATQGHAENLGGDETGACASPGWVHRERGDHGHDLLGEEVANPAGGVLVRDRRSQESEEGVVLFHLVMKCSTRPSPIRPERRLARSGSLRSKSAASANRSSLLPKLAGFIAWFIFIGPGLAEFTHFIFPLIKPAILPESVATVSQTVSNGNFVANMPNYWLPATGRYYFSGMYTAILLMIPGVWAIVRTRRATRPAALGGRADLGVATLSATPVA